MFSYITHLHDVIITFVTLEFDELDVMELVPNIILNPGFVENEPVRMRDSHAASIIKSNECPGPGKPRRV